jgi:hypothetical protein
MLEIGAEGSLQRLLKEFLDLESEQNFAFAFVNKKAAEHFKNYQCTNRKH